MSAKYGCLVECRFKYISTQLRKALTLASQYNNIVKRSRVRVLCIPAYSRVMCPPLLWRVDTVFTKVLCVSKFYVYILIYERVVYDLMYYV